MKKEEYSALPRYYSGVTILTAISAVIATIITMLPNLSDSLTFFINLIQKSFAYNFVVSILSPIYLIFILLLLVFGFGYALYKVTKLYKERFGTVFFCKNSLYYGTWATNKKNFIKRFILLLLGYSLLVIMIVQTLFVTFPNIESIDIFGRLVPLHIFFALGLIFAIKLLESYAKGVGENLFYTVLFGFYSITIYSSFLLPKTLYEKTLSATPDIVFSTLIFILICDLMVNLYFKMKDIKRSLINR